MSTLKALDIVVVMLESNIHAADGMEISYVYDTTKSDQDIIEWFAPSKVLHIIRN